MDIYTARIRECLQNLFNERGGLPSCVLYITDSKTDVLFFDGVDFHPDSAHCEMSLIAQVVALHLPDIRQIAASTAAWILDNEKLSPVWQKCGGDVDKVYQMIKHEYGGIASCPYRREVILSYADDGQQEYLLTNAVIRHHDSLKVSLLDEERTYKGQSCTDILSGLSGLLAKSCKLSLMLQQARSNYGSPLADDALIFSLLQQTTASMDMSIDLHKVMRVASHKVNEIKRRGTQ